MHLLLDGSSVIFGAALSECPTSDSNLLQAFSERTKGAYINKYFAVLGVVLNVLFERLDAGMVGLLIDSH